MNLLLESQIRLRPLSEHLVKINSETIRTMFQMYYLYIYLPLDTVIAFVKMSYICSKLLVKMNNILDQLQKWLI